MIFIIKRILLTLLVSGTCLNSTLALGNRPSIEAPKNYGLLLDVNVDGKVYHLEYQGLLCEMEVRYSIGIGGWVRQWKVDNRRVAKRFGDGTVIHFNLPAGSYCYKDSSAFAPDIIVSDAKSVPVSIRFFRGTAYDPKTGVSVNPTIKSGKIFRIDMNAPKTQFSKDEEALASSLKQNEGKYVSRLAVLFTEKIWEQKVELKGLLNGLQKPTSAVDVDHPKIGNITYIFTMKGIGCVPSAPSGCIGGEYYEPRQETGQMTLVSPTERQEFTLLRYEPSTKLDNEVVCYREECAQVRGTFCEVYFSRSRALVSVQRIGLDFSFRRQ